MYFVITFAGKLVATTDVKYMSALYFLSDDALKGQDISNLSNFISMLIS